MPPGTGAGVLPRERRGGIAASRGSRKRRRPATGWPRRGPFCGSWSPIRPRSALPRPCRPGDPRTTRDPSRGSRARPARHSCLRPERSTASCKSAGRAGPRPAAPRPRVSPRPSGVQPSSACRRALPGEDPTPRPQGRKVIGIDRTRACGRARGLRLPRAPRPASPLRWHPCSGAPFGGALQSVRQSGLLQSGMLFRFWHISLSFFRIVFYCNLFPIRNEKTYKKYICSMKYFSHFV